MIVAAHLNQLAAQAGRGGARGAHPADGRGGKRRRRARECRAASLPRALVDALGQPRLPAHLFNRQGQEARTAGEHSGSSERGAGSPRAGDGGAEGGGEQRSLAELGLSSLETVELVSRLEGEYHVVLDETRVRADMTLGELRLDSTLSAEECVREMERAVRAG